MKLKRIIAVALATGALLAGGLVAAPAAQAAEGDPAVSKTYVSTTAYTRPTLDLTIPGDGGEYVTVQMERGGKWTTRAKVYVGYVSGAPAVTQRIQLTRTFQTYDTNTQGLTAGWHKVRFVTEAGGISPTVTIKVVKRATTISNWKAKKSSVKRGSTAGRVDFTLKFPGSRTDGKPVTIVIEKKKSGAKTWKKSVSLNLYSSDYQGGKYYYRFGTETKKGTYYYRLRVPATDFTTGVTSKSIKITVK